MTLFAIGMNHRSADVSQRERFVHALSQSPPVIDSLRADCAVEEAVVLATCNRTELYVVTKCHHAVKEWLRKRQRLEQSALSHILYEHHEIDMIKHVMSVASGLDSMILGEPQIFGQMKQAYYCAQQQGTIGQQFQHLFPAVFETAKLVRSQTNIGSHPVTMAYAVIQLAKQLFPQLSECVVLLIGAGEMIELVANYLARHQIKKLLVANRTLARAHQITCQYHGIPLRLTDIAEALPEVDLIISATASLTPVVDEIMIARAMQQRQQRPMFIADLAVPRDVALAVSEIPDVHLYHLDDLQQVIADNQNSRREAAEQAIAIIEVQAAHYLQQLRVRDSSDMIRSYRKKMEQWRDQELASVLRKLAKGEDPQVALTELARRLTNKFMHKPTNKLRNAAYKQHSAWLTLLRELYDL